MRLLKIGIILFSFFFSAAQDDNSLIKITRVAIEEKIVIDSVSINPYFFQVLKLNNDIVHDSMYTIDFESAVVRFKSNYNELKIRIYFPKIQRIYSLHNNIRLNTIKLFHYSCVSCFQHIFCLHPN